MFNERLEIKEKQRKRLKAGLQKIEEGLQCAKFKCGHFIHSSAAKLVDELKAKAREQQTLLQQKQQEADTALVDITSSMQPLIEAAKQVFDIPASFFVEFTAFIRLWARFQLSRSHTSAR